VPGAGGGTGWHAGRVFERFTDRSRRVLVLAQEEARLLTHPHIGPEHILLGLVEEGSGVAARALASAGLELEPARENVHRLTVATGAGSGAPPFTPDAKKVLERALRELLARGGTNIGTEHLLLGLLAVDNAVVASTLSAFGTDGDDVRRRVEEILGGEEPGAAGPAPSSAAVPTGAIERFFGFLSARDWGSLGILLSPEVERTGPLGDLVRGRTPYLDLLRESVPDVYANDVHRITYALGAASGFARVTEHLGYPDRDLHLEEAYFFAIDPRGLITRVEIFWQGPEAPSG
jgi:hypothetical protein